MITNLKYTLTDVKFRINNRLFLLVITMIKPRILIVTLGKDIDDIIKIEDHKKIAGTLKRFLSVRSKNIIANTIRDRLDKKYIYIYNNEQKYD